MVTETLDIDNPKISNLTSDKTTFVFGTSRLTNGYQICEFVSRKWVWMTKLKVSMDMDNVLIFKIVLEKDIQYKLEMHRTVKFI
jgi:hypothetical protein